MQSPWGRFDERADDRLHEMSEVWSCGVCAQGRGDLFCMRKDKN